MLDQLLKSGLSMLNSKGAQQGDSSAGLGKLGNLGNLGAGVTAGGVLGLLLGTKRGRSMGCSALKYGSVAALGAVAFRAYTQWQATQAPQAQQTQQAPQGLAAESLPVRTVNLLCVFQRSWTLISV